MKIPIKLTAAAIILIAATLSLTLFDKTVPSAWAIEDTIKALENISSIKILATVTNESGDIELGCTIWAKPNEDKTETGQFRLEIPGVQTTVVIPSGVTYLHKIEQNVVSVTEYKNASLNPWFGSNFFNHVKKFAEDWKISYGLDEETGKESIFATFLDLTESKSFWVQFDSESKLPVKLKQWMNLNFEGKPQFYATSIEYNPELPEGIFEFEMPEGAEVVRVPRKTPEYFDDPNVGIVTEDLTDEDACLLLVKNYWRAIIDGDWEYLAQVRPVISSAAEWEFKFKRNVNWPSEVLEIGQPYETENCNIGPIVPCRIKYSNGQTRNIQLVIRIRNIDGVKSCLVAGTYGGIKDFDM